MADRCHRHDIGGKKARIYDRGTRRVHISQNGDEWKEAVVARRGSGDCQQARQEGQDHRVRHACRGRNPVDGQYGRFDGPTFVRYLKEVRRKWGKILLVTDNASPHKHREVRKHLEEHDGLEILYLPTAAPKLGAVESVWKDAKYRLVTSEHYEALEDLTHAVSEYFRTCSIRLDIYRFLYRCV